ncbi:MAG TPA: SRPBCC family protein [Steroidobacteraceae bacterium]|nr:SRPBCC family protein [Steroidobacteraceae bacterium]
MGSITKVVLADAAPDAVWDAVRDVGALHTRLVPGFVANTELVPGGRRVTFASGRTVEEPIVSCSDSLRRLVWTVRAEGFPFTHYNGCVQVHARAAGGSRVEWTADFLPDSAGTILDGLMSAGAAAMAEALQALAGQGAGTGASSR